MTLLSLFALALALAMIPNKNRNQVVPEGKIMVG